MSNVITGGYFSEIKEQAKAELTPKQVLTAVANELEKESDNLFKCRVLSEWIPTSNTSANDEEVEEKSSVLLRLSWDIYLPKAGGFWREFVFLTSTNPNGSYPVHLVGFGLDTNSGLTISNRAKNIIATSEIELKKVLGNFLKEETTKKFLAELYRKANDFSTTD